DEDGVLEAVDGADAVRAADGVLELQLAEPRKAVKAAGSNNEYLGHVMVGDAQGPGARGRVEALLAQLRPRVAAR
ncbi:carboxylate--amine ligase, partial [Streptomyces sp. NPDC058757]